MSKKPNQGSQTHGLNNVFQLAPFVSPVVILICAATLAMPNFPLTLIASVYAPHDTGDRKIHRATSLRSSNPIALTFSRAILTLLHSPHLMLTTWHAHQNGACSTRRCKDPPLFFRRYVDSSTPQLSNTQTHPKHNLASIHSWQHVHGPSTLRHIGVCASPFLCACFG